MRWAASAQSRLRPDDTDRSSRHPLFCQVRQHGLALGNFVGVLFMFERAGGALPGDLGASEMDTEAVGAQSDAMLLLDPVGKLGSSPGALAFADFGANGLKHE